MWRFWVRARETLGFRHEQGVHGTLIVGLFIEKFRFIGSGRRIPPGFFYFQKNFFRMTKSVVGHRVYYNYRIRRQEDQRNGETANDSVKNVAFQATTFSKKCAKIGS
jgi:hypothetical protein